MGGGLHVLKEVIVGEAVVGALGDEAPRDGLVGDAVDTPREGAVGHDPRKPDV
jgi:hypothetical protein